MASCGYLVVTITHGDGSADYHPDAGPFPEDYELFEYDARNREVKIREKEVMMVINMMTNKSSFIKGPLKDFGEKWSNINITEDIIVMGHSFGGCTTLGVGARDPRVKGLIALDPWFFPRYKDKIKLLDH